jgi:hypothetical protein
VDVPQLLAAIAPSLFAAGGSAALLTTAGTLTGLGVAVSIGGSFLLSAIVGALGPRERGAQTAARELALPTNAPAYRFVYGECRATGTPVASVVRGEYLWACYLLNSRPSALPNFTLFLDKREIVLTGDAFDFTASGGARANAEPFWSDGIAYLRVWISRGDKTTPPQRFLNDVPWGPGADTELFLPTDGWQGRTVLWLRARNRGKQGDQQRWVSAPPLVEVEGRWSRVYDPRNPAHDPDNPNTWAWSDNHALCVMDALRTNPIRPYSMANLEMGLFNDAIAVSDEIVALRSGGSEPRYRAAGTVVWDGGEMEDRIMPLVLSGGGDLVRVGGRLGLAAGKYRAPTMTLDYLLGDGFEATDLLPGTELANELRVSYLSQTRGGEIAELRPWPIPGAQEEDGGVPSVRSIELSHCPSPTQAMRVRKIIGLRMRRQERLVGGELPPEAFNLIAGSTVTLSLPAPYDVLNGIYEVESLHPALDPLGDGGVALRMPARLVKHSAAPYAWVPATDEEDVVDEPYTGDRANVALPGPITATIQDFTSGTATVQQITFKFDPSTSSGVVGYEWQWRTTDSVYQTGGMIDDEVDDGSGKVFGVLNIATASSHDIRVRTVARGGVSGWRSITGIQPLTLGNVSATAGLGSATFTGTAPASITATKIRVYRGNTFTGAVQVGSDFTVTPGASFSITAGDDTRTNLFVNGDMSSETGWTLDPDVSIGSGVMTKVPGTLARFGHQSPTLTAGDVLRVSLNVTAWSAGGVRFRIIGNTTNDSASRGSVGQLLSTLTVPTNPTQLRIAFNAVADMSVDDAVAYVQTATCLPQGTNNYWLAPVTTGGAIGTPSGPFALTII